MRCHHTNSEAKNEANTIELSLPVCSYIIHVLFYPYTSGHQLADSFLSFVYGHSDIVFGPIAINTLTPLFIGLPPEIKPRSDHDLAFVSAHVRTSAFGL